MAMTHEWEHIAPASFDRYFLTRSPADLYDRIKGEVAEHFMLTGAFLALGASTAFFSVTLRANETTTIEFKDHGIPPGSLVLDVNRTGTGGPMSIEWQINSSQQRFADRGTMHLYGACPSGSMPREGSVSVAVTWIAPPDATSSLRHLIDAVTAFSDAVALGTQGLSTIGHFDRVVVPANIAAESALARVMYEAVSAFTSKKQTGQFLSDGATYAYQLKVLVPIIAHMIAAPDLPSDIRGALDRLRGHRNKIAHEGRPKVPLTRVEAAEMLTAALFGYHYARLLGELVQRAKYEGRLPARGGEEQ